MVYWTPCIWHFDLPYHNHGISTHYSWYFDSHSIHGISNPLFMVFWANPWYIELPAYGILTPLSMVYWTPCIWHFDPPLLLYPWYIKSATQYMKTPTDGISNPLLVVYWSPCIWYFNHTSTHGILIPLHMVFWPPYPWYIEPSAYSISNLPPIHGISDLMDMVFSTPPPTHGILITLHMDFVSMVCPTPCLWYFDSTIPLSMVYRTPCVWYFDPTHGILKPT